MRKMLPLGLLVACTGGTVVSAEPRPEPSASAPAPLDASEARATAETLAGMLETNFVYPEAGRRYAEMLRTRAVAGGYDGIADRAAFARQLTDELQAVAADGHLRVMLPPPRPRPGEGPNGPPGATETPFEAGRWIAPGIAYARFSAFPGDPATVAAAQRFMADHQGARTLILDIRTHRGGGLAEMDAMLPLLYAAPTVLVTMETRSAVEREHGPMLPEGPTLRRVASPDAYVRREHHVTPGEATPWRDARVFLLTSSVTGSAAEHLALALKRTHRATLIGEATAGANHFGGIAPVGAGFAAFMPVGRTYDPDTGTGWEGTGVAPDVAVPAERALVEALLRAGVAPGEAERLSAEVNPPATAMHRDRGRPRG